MEDAGEDNALLPGGGDDLVDALGGGFEWFFDQEVFAGGDDLERDVEVRAAGGA